MRRSCAAVPGPRPPSIFWSRTPGRVQHAAYSYSPSARWPCSPQGRIPVSPREYLHIRSSTASRRAHLMISTVLWLGCGPQPSRQLLLQAPQGPRSYHCWRHQGALLQRQKRVRRAPAVWYPRHLHPGLHYRLPECVYPLVPAICVPVGC